MSVRIRIELRDEEGMFGSLRLTRVELTRILEAAQREPDFSADSGPFTDGIVQAFSMEIADPRQQWTGQPGREPVNSGGQS